MRDAFVDEDLRRANALRLLAIGEDDPLRIADGAVDDAAHDTARAPEPGLQTPPVVLELDELARDAARHGGPRNGRRDPEQRPRVEGEGNEVVGPELDVTQ